MFDFRTLLTQPKPALLCNSKLF